LEDINVWDNTRFYQEGIQNVQALATTDLARLAVRTPYDAQTLVDWVDQALLRIHTKVLWHAGMAAIGIRCATDLFDVAEVDEEGKCSGERLNCIVDAFNAAQLMSIGTDDPRFEAYNEAAALETASETLAAKAQTVKSSMRKLDPAKPETLDKIIALRGYANGLKSSAQLATKSRRQVRNALVSLNAEDAARPWADGGEIDRQLEALMKGDSSLITQAEKAVKEEKLTRKMLHDDLAKAAEADKAGQVALQAAQEAIKALVDPVEKAKKAAVKVAPQLTQIKSLITPVKKKVDILREKTDSLLNKTAAAKTQADGLTQTNAKKLNQKLDEALTAASAVEASAAELVAIVKAGDDRFKIFMDKAAAIKKALGTDKDQLQAKLKAAKEEIAKVANDPKAVADVQSAVTAVDTDVGHKKSMDSDTIAGQVNTIVEPFKDVEAKLDKAVTTVTDLAAAISQTNTLAQGIYKKDAASWDYVKALASTLSKLKVAIQNTVTKHSQVHIRLGGLNKQQTIALREAQKKVKELATNDAAKKVEAAEKVFTDEADNNVPLSADSSDKDLNEGKKKAGSAVTAAETLASNAEKAAEEVMRTVLPLRLTKGILEVMLGAMEHAPNIHYLRHYWQVQGDKFQKTNG
jgi:hypothetical protein